MMVKLINNIIIINNQIKMCISDSVKQNIHVCLKPLP